jgi:hypothetical protein
MTITAHTNPPEATDARPLTGPVHTFEPTVEEAPNAGSLSHYAIPSQAFGWSTRVLIR